MKFWKKINLKRGLQIAAVISLGFGLYYYSALNKAGRKKDALLHDFQKLNVNQIHSEEVSMTPFYIGTDSDTIDFNDKKHSLEALYEDFNKGYDLLKEEKNNEVQDDFVVVDGEVYPVQTLEDSSSEPDLEKLITYVKTTIEHLEHQGKGVAELGDLLEVSSDLELIKRYAERKDYAEASKEYLDLKQDIYLLRDKYLDKVKETNRQLMSAQNDINSYGPGMVFPFMLAVILFLVSKYKGLPGSLDDENFKPDNRKYDD